MGNKSLKLLLIPILIFMCSCTRYPGYFTSEHYNYAYGIIEDGKVDRREIPRDDVFAINKYILKEYGVFLAWPVLIISFDIDENLEEIPNEIKFYDDIIITIDGKKHILPKEQIEIYQEYEGPKNRWYYRLKPLPKELKPTRISGNLLGLDPKELKTLKDEYILDLGEIEILRDGKIVRERREIPAFLMKKVYQRYKEWTILYGARGLIYRGWAVDYTEEVMEDKEKKFYMNE